jgi:Ni/Co efflux regulator RcnB
MKKFILAALAASVAAAPVAAAPAFAQNGRGQVVQVQKHKQVRSSGRTVVKTKQVVRTRQAQAARNWRKGERFDSRQARNYRVISNPRAYRLYDAPRGYRWVQSNNDAVLVAITSGIIGAVLGSRF